MIFPIGTTCSIMISDPPFVEEGRGEREWTHQLIAIPVQRRPLQDHPELFPFVAQESSFLLFPIEPPLAVGMSQVFTRYPPSTHAEKTCKWAHEKVGNAVSWFIRQSERELYAVYLQEVGFLYQDLCKVNVKHKVSILFLNIHSVLRRDTIKETMRHRQV